MFQRYVVLFITLGLLIIGSSSMNVQITPPYLYVPSGAHNVTVLCTAGVPINYCHFTVPGVGSVLNLTSEKGSSLETSLDTRYNYYGTSLEEGQCGINLAEVQDKHNGRITCSVGSAEGEFSASMELVVLIPPSSIELNISQEYNRDGDELTVTCTVRHSRPRAIIMWYLDAVDVEEGLSPLEVVDEEDDLKTVVQHLKRTLSWEDDMKLLTCRAGHSALQGDMNTEASQIMHVTYAPRQQKSPIVQPMRFLIVQSTVIVIVVQANPRPSFVWTIGDVRVQEGEADPSGKFVATSAQMVEMATWKLVLYVHSVTAADMEQSYYLVAKNTEGETQYLTIDASNSEAMSKDKKMIDWQQTGITAVIISFVIVAVCGGFIAYTKCTGRSVVEVCPRRCTIPIPCPARRRDPSMIA